jgi:glycosyltransferase involved in cell wall biosynthesis
MFEVQVLLATYNGGRFIDEFLNSLILQTDVRIHLIVSDDGSSDETLKILQKYCNLFESYKLLVGPKKGAIENFVHLFKNRYQNLPVAFADQDDIWLSHKLRTALSSLSPDFPTLFYSRCKILGSKRIIPDDFKTRKYGHIFGNSAMGCTQVLNIQMCEILDKNMPPVGVHIDWWTFIIAIEENAAFKYDEHLILYRLHSNTVVGIPSLNKRLLRIFHRLRKKKTLIPIEIEKVLDAMSDYQNMTGRRPEVINFLNNFSIIEAMKQCVLKNFRRTFLQNIFVMFLILEYRKKLTTKTL